MSTENLFRFWCRSQFLFSALLAQRAGRIQGWDAWTKGVSVGDADLGSPVCRSVADSSHTCPSKFLLGRGD